MRGNATYQKVPFESKKSKKEKESTYANLGDRMSPKAPLRTYDEPPGARQGTKENKLAEQRKKQGPRLDSVCGCTRHKRYRPKMTQYGFLVSVALYIHRRACHFEAVIAVLPPLRSLMKPEPNWLPFKSPDTSRGTRKQHTDERTMMQDGDRFS